MRGRNDPCPCGSGLKYKKCCMLKDQAPSQSLHYQRLGDAYDRLVRKLIQFAEKRLDSDDLSNAMEEFLLWPEPDTLDREASERHSQLFWQWFAFNWAAESTDTDADASDSAPQTIADLYVQDCSDRLDPLERQLLEATNHVPFTFYETTSVSPKRGMSLKDVMTGATVDVLEISGSEHLRKGDIIFARAVAVDGIGMLLGLGVTVIPPRYKPEIIRLRQKLAARVGSLTPESLRKWDFQLRELFIDIEERLHAPPILCNTDGEPIEFRKVIYAIDSVDEAFEGLADLCFAETKEDLRAQAAFDNNGRMKRVEFPWLRPADKKTATDSHGILGSIEIAGQRLIIEVNSEAREQGIRREIEARLGDSARYLATEITSAEQMMREPRAPVRSRQEGGDEDLMDSPDVRQQIKEFYTNHWRAWVDDSIPALGGKTPREAVQTADGREAVEALLFEAERHGIDDPKTGELERDGILLARSLLGLGGPQHGE